jgi:hypothetical protein
MADIKDKNALKSGVRRSGSSGALQFGCKQEKRNEYSSLNVYGSEMAHLVKNRYQGHSKVTKEGAIDSALIY